MYHPTTRLLTILEVLQTQTRGQISGAELARRLDVEPRTVRRYVLMLQEMGMPIEGVHGPGGGYQLRPGFKLPPLLFTEDEAMAIMLGLLGLTWLEIDPESVAVEGALAKLHRVLPVRGRERLQALAEHTILSPQQHDARPSFALLMAVSEAVQAQQRLQIEYASYRNEVTQREIEPYSLVGWKGHWYVVGWCCLRQDYRLFRLDRVRQIQRRTATFQRAADFDCRAYVKKVLADIPAWWTITIEFQAPLYAVQSKVPSSFGPLTETPTGVLLRTHAAFLDEFARYLAGWDLPFVIHEPPELRDAVLHLAQRLMQMATACGAVAQG
jgi:predicted DNA-binding transcriptional regulator YafY